MAVTLDTVLTLARATILHPLISTALPAALLVLGFDDLSHATSGNLAQFSSPFKIALGCVVFSWILAGNRILNRRSLNPSPAPIFDWKKEVVVVTGGSGGIGGALVQKLDSMGTTIVVMDVIPLTYTKGPNTHYYHCDISTLESVQATYEKISKAVGRPTILVANAGVVRGRTILEAGEKDVRLTFNVNVFGLIWCIKTFLPAMVASNHGHILITSSVTAFSTVASSSDYAASKAAVTSIFEGLQTELKHKYGNPKVKASAIFPATIRTKMFEGIDHPTTFMLPMLTPEEVADRMVGILKKGESEIAIMPAMGNVLPWMRCLPTWMRIAAQDGGATSMDKLSNVGK